MSKNNRRIALSHAVHLALHGNLSESGIVSKATELVGFLDDLPTLNVEAGAGNDAADYEAGLVAVLKHPVAGLRKKNAEVLTECLAQVAELTIADVLQAGPGYLFDLEVSEKRRGKILEDLYAVADAYEVELSDVEAYVSVSTSLWSNGHEDRLFNGGAIADYFPLSFKEAVRADIAAQQREAEQADKPKCGCPDHTPFSNEELPNVTLDRLDISPEAVESLKAKGINTVQDLRHAGPRSVLDLCGRDQTVLGTFVLALTATQPVEAAEPARESVEMTGGYLDLHLTDFADVHADIIADLQSKGAQTLRDVFNNPLLIPSVMTHGVSLWLPLIGHLLTGLKKEIEDNPGLSDRTRRSLTGKHSALEHMFNIAKDMAAAFEAPVQKAEAPRSLRDLLGTVRGSMGRPVVIEGNSPEGQALLALLRDRSGNPEASSGVVKVDSETDPAFASLIDRLFNSKTPTKH